MKAFRYLLAIFYFLAFFSIGHAYAKDNVTQAKEFMKAGMYPQAIAVLEKEIYGNEKAKVKANPMNAEAQFLLGVCYANQSRYNDADERFASAVKLKPNYGYRIGEVYRTAGSSSLENGNIETAEVLFQKTVKYQPDLIKTIASELLNTGKGNNNDHLLSMAVNYNGELRGDVSGYYYGLSQSIGGEEGLNALKKANEFNGGNAYRADIAKKVLELCDGKSKPENREACINTNSDYLDSNQTFESSVRFYTKLWGVPSKVEGLNGDWVEAARIKNGEIVHFLSLKKFSAKCENSKRVWDEAIKSDGQIQVFGIKDNAPLYFSLEKNQTVYIWKGQ